MQKHGEVSRRQAYYIVALQLVSLLIVATLYLFVSNSKNSYSALLGGLAAWLPSVYFVLKVFSKTSAHQAKQIMMRFFIAEMVKLVLSAVLFVVIVMYLPVNVLATLVGFSAALLGIWLSPLAFMKTRVK